MTLKCFGFGVMDFLLFEIVRVREVYRIATAPILRNTDLDRLVRRWKSLVVFESVHYRTIFFVSMWGGEKRAGDGKGVVVRVEIHCEEAS